MDKLATAISDACHRHMVKGIRNPVASLYIVVRAAECASRQCRQEQNNHGEKDRLSACIRVGQGEK